MRFTAMLHATADRKVASIAAELEAERARIADAVAAKAVGDGSGYWKRRHDLQRQLAAAVAVRDAMAEAAE